jgi:pimeloyl-ACP methyl ester carboxylesterase
MRKIRSILVVTLVGILLGCQSIQIKTENPNMPYNVYLDGGESTVAVILSHGRGHGPTWRVVNPLRKGIHEQLGYHTLSLQMPTSDVNWREYRHLFPDAYKRIEIATQVLREEKGVKKIYLMGHSMGSRMATGYLAENPESKISGFIGVGIRNYGETPLDSLRNLQVVMQKYPDIIVLDVYGDGGDGRDAKHAQKRSFLVSDRYKQIIIPGADHQFNSGEKQMVNSVVNWLRDNE